MAITKPAGDSAAGEALLYATMCVIGCQVEVQVKDGSLYSGVLHTACFDDAHGIVLKKARKIRNGESMSNLGLGDCVDSLVVLFHDLVQVVVKDVLLHAPGTVNDDASNVVEMSSCNIQTHASSMVSEVENERFMDKNPLKSLSDPNIKVLNSAINEKKNAGRVIDVHKVGDRKQNGNCSEKGTESLPQVSVKERQIAVSSALGDNCCALSDKVVDDVQDLRSSDRNEVQCSSVASLPVQLVSPESKTVVSSNSLPVDVKVSLTHSSVCTDGSITEKRIGNSSTKESKLNPSAQIFTPKYPSSKTAPQTVSTIASPGYIPAIPIPSPQWGTEVRPLPSRSSIAGKLVAYNNVVPGQTGITAQYARPVLGYANVRHQPMRLNGQCDHIPAGPPSVYPQPQAMTFGRPGQFVYVNPVTQDTIQGQPIITHGLGQPLFTSFPANLEKSQATGTPVQTMQLSMTPPFAAGISPTVFAPAPHPLPQPFPTAIPIMVPGGTGFFSSKFQ